MYTLSYCPSINPAFGKQLEEPKLFSPIIDFCTWCSRLTSHTGVTNG